MSYRVHIEASWLSAAPLEELSWIRYKMDLNIIIPVLLFVLLSPGVLLALPPGAGKTTQVLTHAVVFGVVYWGLRKTFPQYY